MKTLRDHLKSRAIIELEEYIDHQGHKELLLCHVTRFYVTFHASKLCIMGSDTSSCGD